MTKVKFKLVKHRQTHTNPKKSNQNQKNDIETNKIFAEKCGQFSRKMK